MIGVVERLGLVKIKQTLILLKLKSSIIFKLKSLRTYHELVSQIEQKAKQIVWHLMTCIQ